jgi:hypothetical protein
VTGGSGVDVRECQFELSTESDKQVYGDGDSEVERP